MEPNWKKSNLERFSLNERPGMITYFDDPYRKQVSDKFYKLFLEHLRNEGKISEQIFQHITVKSEPEPPTLYEQASNELFKMRAKLEHTIATCYIPESTRWHRNYTDRADWYYLCRVEGWL